MMTRTTWSRAAVGGQALALALIAGCSSKEPELIPDPALASKPFPKVDSPADKVKPKPVSFPKVGDRRAGP